MRNADMPALVDTNRLEAMRADLPREQVQAVNVGDMVAQAAQALTAGDAAAAQPILQAAVLLDPDDAEAWVWMARTQQARNFLEEARTAYGNALASNPDDGETALALARLMRRMGDSGPARALLVWMLLRFHTPSLVEAAAAELQRIDRGGAR